jgi:hypothetical protein
MRYLIMHRTNPHYESGGLPDSDLIANVGSMIGEMVKRGVLQGAEGLRSSAEGVRLSYSDGEQSVTPGPFPGSNELPAVFSIVRTGSIAEAIDFAAGQAQVLESAEVDIRPVTEPWDIGMAERPPSVTTHRYMVLHKATPATEAGAAPTASQRARLTKLIDDATRTGVHQVTETLRPSRRGRRLTNTRNGVVMVDGPFAETKELVGGYVIVAADSLDEATGWAERYIGAVDTGEVDVRELE